MCSRQEITQEVGCSLVRMYNHMTESQASDTKLSSGMFAFYPFSPAQNGESRNLNQTNVGFLVWAFAIRLDLVLPLYFLAYMLSLPLRHQQKLEMAEEYRNRCTRNTLSFASVLYLL